MIVLVPRDILHFHKNRGHSTRILTSKRWLRIQNAESLNKLTSIHGCLYFHASATPSVKEWHVSQHNSLEHQVCDDMQIIGKIMSKGCRQSQKMSIATCQQLLFPFIAK